MGYNKDLDEVIWSREENLTDPFGDRVTKSKFIVSVMRYAGGKAKMDIKRLSYGAYKKGEYGKLGRISLYEITKLLPAIEAAINVMKQENNP